MTSSLAEKDRRAQEQLKDERNKLTSSLAEKDRRAIQKLERQRKALEARFMEKKNEVEKLLNEKRKTDAVKLAEEKKAIESKFRAEEEERIRSLRDALHNQLKNELSSKEKVLRRRLQVEFDAKLKNNVAQQKAELLKRKELLEASIHKQVGALLG